MNKEELPAHFIDEFWLSVEDAVAAMSSLSCYLKGVRFNKSKHTPGIPKLNPLLLISLKKEMCSVTGKFSVNWLYVFLLAGLKSG